MTRLLSCSATLAIMAIIYSVPVEALPVFQQQQQQRQRQTTGSSISTRTSTSIRMTIDKRTPTAPQAPQSASFLPPSTLSEQPSFSRRRFFWAAAGIRTSMGINQSANALKDRNEKFCGTGFFTNIAQYACTDIGDISDEGNPAALSGEQTASTESLLSKFSLDEETSRTKDRSKNDDTSEKDAAIAANKPAR